MALVLILTHARDDTVSLVVPHLQRRNIDFVRFNTEEFPQKVKIALYLTDGLCKGCLSFPEREVRIEEIGAIWNRRPHKPEIDPKVSDPTVREWAETEAYHGLNYLWSMLQDRFWLNPIRPEHRIQDNKFIQLLVAHRVGLLTPPSVLSNDPASIQSFWDDLATDLALKKVQTGVLEYPTGEVGLLHTIKLSRPNCNNADISRLRFYAAFLQKYIPKEVDLRVTVIGQTVFACEIHSKDHEWTRDDWRRQIFLKDLLPHRPHNLPQSIQAKCVDLIQQLGLYFGAIDMALTPDGKYVFFEVNPNGQWAWIERLTGMPISEAIAEYLATKAGR